MAKSTFKTMICTHLQCFTGLCVRSEQTEKDNTTSLDYIGQNTRLSKIRIADLKDQNTRNMLDQRKLCLVLDLDHTLVHTVNNTTNLRPFVHTFLEEANKLFKLYIYTMGNRCYADKVARILDPKGIYFGSRVISKEDCTKQDQKGLDVVLVQESVVLILDDSEAVWPDHKENLIPIPQYKYNCFTYELGSATLKTALKLLTMIHAEFFMKYDWEKYLEKVHTKLFIKYDLENVIKADARKVFKVIWDNFGNRVAKGYEESKTVE